MCVNRMASLIVVSESVLLHTIIDGFVDGVEGASRLATSNDDIFLFGLLFKSEDPFIVHGIRLRLQLVRGKHFITRFEVIDCVTQIGVQVIELQMLVR